jgi:hypothetical protein
MTTPFRATDKQWADVERWATETSSASDACFLELRSRIEALEAHSQPTPNQVPIRSSLVERVARAIGRDDEPINWEPEASAAIREVLAWLKEGEHTWAALKLEQEMGR